MKFLYSIFIVLVLVFMFGTKGGDYEIIQTSNTKNKKTVVLDAGHGQPDWRYNKF